MHARTLTGLGVAALLAAAAAAVIPPIGFDFADRAAVSDVLAQGTVDASRGLETGERDRVRIRREHALTNALIETIAEQMGESVLLEVVRDAQDVADRWEEADLDLMLATRINTLGLREALVVLRDETADYDPADVTPERELRLRRILADVLLRFDQLIIGMDQFAADVRVRDGRGGSRRTVLTPWRLLRDAIKQIDHRIVIDGVYAERRGREAATVLQQSR